MFNSYDEWLEKDASFEKCFKELEEYKKEHGATRVPQKNKALYKWFRVRMGIEKDRGLDKTVTGGKMDRLLKLGCNEWKKDARFEKCFKELEECKQEHGTTRVHHKNKALYKWIRLHMGIEKDHGADQNKKLTSQTGL